MKKLYDLVFPKVSCVIDPSIGVFEIRVHLRETGAFLGGNGPLFTPFSPQQCRNCGENYLEQVVIPLDQTFIGSSSFDEEEITLKDIDWTVLAQSERGDCANKLNEELIKRVILEEPFISSQTLEIFPRMDAVLMKSLENMVIEAHRHQPSEPDKSA